MPKTNLSLGNLFRATTGAARTSQASSINARNGSAGTQVSFGSFAIDSVSPNVPTFTYIVESTTETAGFTFGSPGAVHGTRVGSVAANYTVSFNNANFSVGSATLGASPSFPITPASIAQSTYSEAQSTLSMTYVDGFNTAATGYNSTTTKVLYAVDVYNTINQPDFCLLFGTKIQLANGSEINVEDLNVSNVVYNVSTTGIATTDYQTIKNDLVVTVVAQNGENGEPTTLTTTVPKGTARDQRFALGNDLQLFDRVIDAYVSPGSSLTRINNGPILWDIYDLITIETTP
jgi:hypothetical protein